MNSRFFKFLICSSALLALITTSPLSARAEDDKLFEFLVKFATAQDKYHNQKYPEAEQLAVKLYEEVKQNGFDQADASARFKCPSGLDEVTPVLTVPRKYGNIYQRLFIECLKLRGMARSANGNTADGFKDLNNVVDFYPDFAEGHAALAMHFKRTKEFEKGLRELQHAIDLKPKLNQAFLIRALIYRELEMTPQERIASDEYARLRTAQEKEIAEFVRNVNSMTKTQGFEARAAQLIKDYPTQPKPVSMYAEIISVNRMDDAKKYATVAIACSSTLPYGYATRADLNLDLGLLSDAIKDANSAIAIEPTNLDMRITLGLAYLNMNRLDDALRELNNAISRAPRWPIPYSCRAAVYMTRGDFKHALADARTSVSIDPEDPLAYNTLGVCYSQLKMYPEAQNAFAHMVLLERKNQGYAGALARFNLGRCFQRQNKFEMAKKEYDQTLIADPDYSRHILEKSARSAQSGFRDQEVKATLSSGKLPTVPFVQVDCLEDAASLLSRKIELVPRNSTSTLIRGYSYACLDKTREAYGDLDRYIRFEKSKLDRAILLSFLCHERANKKDVSKTLLRANLDKIENHSFSKLAHFFLGDVGEAEVATPTGSIASDTIIHCDLAYHYITLGERSRAKPHIEWVLLHGDRRSEEYLLALTELERMCGRHSI